MSWYEDNIEEEVRSLVKLLRDNGFNTECSCGHEKYIQCQYGLDGEIQRLHKLLCVSGYLNYTITITIKVDNGHQYSTMVIVLSPMRMA